MLVTWMSADDHLSPLDRAMARFAAGEDAALGDVYDLGAPAVFTFLMKLCRDRPLAEDLTQETFLRIHRARGLYRAGAAVLPWAYTIARHLFLDSVRSRRPEASASEACSDNADGSPATREWRAPGPSAEELLADAELAHVLDDALAKLPEAQASAFRLLKGEGLSVAEVAAVMGTTKGAVKLRAHRAYQALRGLLVGHFPNSGIIAEEREGT
jgi:RNA polymerase sigma-70 factor (ECF subfamily)